eukprot:gene5988-6684_t
MSKAKKRKVKEPNHKKKEVTLKRKEQGAPQMCMNSIIRGAFESMAKNAVLKEMYGEVLQRLMEEPADTTDFLSGLFKNRLERKTKSLDSMWTNFQKVWVDQDVRTNVQAHFGVSKEFSSWLLLHCQEEIAKQKIEIEELHQQSEELTNSDREVISYICGAVLSKLIKKTYDTVRKKHARKETKIILRQRIELLNCCKGDEEEWARDKKLINTLNRGGLTYPKAQFVEIFYKAEEILRKAISSNPKRINVAAIAVTVFKEASLLLSASKCLFHSVDAASDLKDTVFKDAIRIYIKIRAHAHARHVIETHKCTTGRQKKEKALRKKLKLSS